MHDLKGYSSPELRVKPILYFLIWFVITMVVLLGGLRLWYRGRTSVLIGKSVSEAPALEQPLQPSPTHPTLPWEDMKALEQQQEKILREGDGKNRIPIGRAMEDLLNSGALKESWTPTTQPWQRPVNESQHSVENRT